MTAHPTNTRSPSTPSRALTSLALLVVLGLASSSLFGHVAGCYEGGLNTHESTAGNSEGGAQLGHELALSDDARFLVTLSVDEEGAQEVWSVDLEALEAVELPLEDPAQRLIFGQGSLAYVLSIADMDAAGTTWKTTLRELDLKTGEKARTWGLGGPALLLSIDADRAHVAAWNPLPWKWAEQEDGNHEYALTLVELDSGTVRLEAFDHPTTDVRFLPGSGELAVVLDTGNMTSQVVFIEPSTGARTSIAVPNCASSLQIHPEGRIAMLAPTHCTKDPVSVIDLEAHVFLENLPGFGPVAFSPDGQTALAFGRKDDLEAVAGIDTDAAFSLLFIDTETLAIDVLELGESLPIYTITPDSEVVLIYSVMDSASFDGIVLVDVETRSLRETMGPDVDLTEFVMTPDGRLVYLIDGGLFRLDVASGSIEFVTLTCGGEGEPTRCNPDLVNLFPNGETLVLGYLLDNEFALWDVEGGFYDAVFSLDRREGASQGPKPVELF